MNILPITPLYATRLKKNFFIALCLALFLVTGCSGPLNYAYNPKPPEQITKQREPITVFIGKFTDSRPSAGLDEKARRTIGKITVNVSDMTDTSLTLNKDIPEIVRAAFIKELGWAGYNVKTASDDASAPATDYILSADVKGFTLDIGARDAISIAAFVKLVNARDSSVVWSDEEIYKNDRFAGSFGNSRSTISAYISQSLSNLVRKTLNDAGQPISYIKYAPQAVKENAAAAVASTGTLIINSAPQRARVYLGDVYYGLTPFNSGIEAGVYNLSVKLEGFKDENEKISIRKGQTTEMEIKLEKK